jgi:hypothetical protein
VFNFVKCVIEKRRIYGLDRDGVIYEMSMPKAIPASDCPACVVKAFLARNPPAPKDKPAAVRR